jgi:hypothetical protein
MDLHGSELNMSAVEPSSYRHRQRVLASRCYMHLQIPSISISVIDSREKIQLMEISVVDIDFRHADTANYAQVHQKTNALPFDTKTSVLFTS